MLARGKRGAGTMEKPDPGHPQTKTGTTRVPASAMTSREKDQRRAAGKDASSTGVRGGITTQLPTPIHGAGSMARPA